MLKLFGHQGKNTAVLFRACLPAVVSSNLCNTRQTLKYCRRNMSDNPDGKPPTTGSLPSTGHFCIWSLISHEGDSLMTLSESDVIVGRPGIKCSGSYDDRSSLINVLNSTVFPQPSHTLLLTLNDASQTQSEFYLSVIEGEEANKYVVITKPALDNEKPNIMDSERFIPWRHGSYSMFESKKYRDTFLGCNRYGTLDLINVHDRRHPDSRVLFLMHLNLFAN
ncbi:hypothetical protein ACROYT_G037237 [Oculina patagonica]